MQDSNRSRRAGAAEAGIPERRFMPPPLAADLWGDDPFVDVRPELGAGDVAWSAAATESAFDMLLALDSAASRRDGRVRSTSPAALLRLSPLLAEADRERCFGAQLPELGRAFCAPALFRLQLEGLFLEVAGRRALFRPGKGGRLFVFLCPRRWFHVPEQLGWRWNRAMRCWTTPHAQCAAALAAFADADAAAEIVRFGTPRSLHPWLRGAPALLPGRTVFHFVIGSRARAGATFPRGWRESGWRPPLPSLVTRNVTVAAGLRDWAPKPLADALRAAPGSVLRNLSLAEVRLRIPDPQGLDAQPAPPPPHPIAVCETCRKVRILDRTALEALHRAPPKTDPCPEPGCRSLLAAPADLLPHVAQASGGAWRTVVYGLARPDLEARRLPPLDDSEIHRLLPPEESFFPLQVEAVRHCLRNPVALEADVMGSGKTVIAIAVINHALSEPTACGKALVVVPAYLRRKWERDLRRWRTGSQMERGRVFLASPRSGPPQGGVYVASYETLRDSALFQSAGWDVAVFDESHFIKNPGAKRTRAALRTRSRRSLFLSGTPHYTSPADLWVTLHRASPEIFASADGFARAHRLKNPRELEEREQAFLNRLSQLLRDTVMIRRPTRTLLADLPPALPDEILPLPVRAAKRIASQERALLDLLARDRTPSVFAQLAKLRQEVGRAKLPAIGEHVKALAATGQPALLFTHHREMAASLEGLARSAGIPVGRIDGSVSERERDRLVGAFQGGEIDMLVATMAAGGAGLDLPRAEQVVFCELDWSPATMAQARGRAWRPGQRHRLRTIYAVADGTLIDPMIASLLSGKEQAEAAAMGDLTPTAIAEQIAAAGSA